MVTFPHLRDLDPRPWQELGATWSRLARRVERRADAVHEQAQRLSGHWVGEAHDAAADRFRRLRGQLDDTSAPLTVIDAGLCAAADDLQRARGMLLDALEAAARIPAKVSEDGETITYTGADANTDPGHRRRVGLRIQAVFDDIDTALAVARKADRAAADALRKLVPGYDPADPSRGRVPASEIPKPGSDPRTVNRWWRGLTPEEQQYLIHHHCGRIGNLDGIPILARDQANRVRLAREQEKAADRKQRLEDRRAELEAELSRAGGTAPGDFEGRAERERIQDELDKVNVELALMDTNLKGMHSLEDRLYESPDKPRAYLIGFEPGTLGDRGDDGVADDDGRAIIAVGNPDTADHVATYVPGTGAGLDSIHKDIYRATGDLRRFQDGLRVTHDGPASHNTVLGHSYGSTVIGHTASGEGGIAADDVVFVASPGVGVDGASDLHVPPEHVWSTTAEHDAINDIAGWHGGKDPSAPGFGGNVFDSDPGNPDDRRGTHSDYWDKGNVARENFGYILTGQTPEGHDDPGTRSGSAPLVGAPTRHRTMGMTICRSR